MREMSHNQTEKNRNTRMKIGEAIIDLMEKNTLDEVKISQVVEKAHVSRMTFYHYYESKEAALMDYLSELMILFSLEANERGINVTLGSIEHIKFSFEFYARYDSFLLRLERSGCYYILINGINLFLEKNYKASFDGNIYNLYYYAGALLNVFMKWLGSGCKESAEEIALIVHAGFSGQ